MHGDARDVLLSQGIMPCPGACENLFGGRRCYSCHKNLERRKQSDFIDDDVSYAVDLGNAMSPPSVDAVPTFTTRNDRILCLLPDGRRGLLRIEDAERLQGLEEGWTSQGLGHLAAKRPFEKDPLESSLASRRWEFIGNAVTVQVARWLGERLANPYAYKYPGISISDYPMDAFLRIDGDQGGGDDPRTRPHQQQISGALYAWTNYRKGRSFLSRAAQKPPVARRRHRVHYAGVLLT